MRVLNNKTNTSQAVLFDFIFIEIYTVCEVM